MTRKIFCVLLAILMMLSCVAAHAQQTAPEATAPEATTPEATTPEEAARQAAVAVSTAFVNNKQDQVIELFADELKLQVSPEVLNTAWALYVSNAGALVGIETEEPALTNGMYTVQVRANMESAVLTLLIGTNAEGRVMGLNVISAEPIEQITVLPEGIVEESVQVGAEPSVLSGTLTLPAGAAAPLPALVLVQGSGPSDRDESVGALKPFRDLAWGMAKRGYAVLRYDKRTFAHEDQFTGEALADLTVMQETIEDAVYASQLLRADARIDKSRVYLVGHSLGGMLGPRICAQPDAGFAGMALLAGSPRTLADIVIEQNEDALARMVEEQRAKARPLVDALKEAATALGGMTEQQARATTFAGANAYYFWEMQQYDAAELLRQSALPALIVQGGRDFQVKPAFGIDAWRVALTGYDRASYLDYPELGHMFTIYSGPDANAGTLAEYGQEQHIPDQVMDDIAAWLAGLATK